MGRVIQMIVTSDNNSLFICGYKKPDTLIFRVSRNPKQLQEEKFVVRNDEVHTNLYNFHVSFLDNFIRLNN
jgi:ribosomal protein L24E